MVTEALILDLPVITTLCAGMQELLDNGRYGIIVENEDSALLDGMKYLLKNRDMVGKAKDRNSFSLKRQMNEVYNVIDK